MAKKKPMSKEERLKRKKEYERRRRERIKMNPELTEALKKQKHEIYLRLKGEGKVKMVDQMTRREKKERRTRWKTNTQNRRARIKATREMEKWCTPPESSENEDNPDNDLNAQGPIQENINVEARPSTDHSHCLKECDSSQKKSGRKRVRKDRSACYRENKKLKIEIEKLKRSKEKYKKKLYRAQKKASSIVANKDITPRKKVKELIKRNGNVSEEVRRELLWSAAMKYNLKEKYKNLRSQKEKQIFGKVVGGKYLRKYRVVNQCTGFLTQKLSKSNVNRLTTFSYERMKSGCQEFVKKQIESFLESDDNSRLCPGKRDIIKRNGVCYQKRYLNGTLKDLRSKFAKSKLNVSLALFCKLRPAWIVKASVSSRDTCLCQRHENLQLLITKLHFLKIIKENTTYEVVNNLTCDSKARNEKCYKRQCGKCEYNNICYSVFNSEELTDYQEWVSEKEERISSKTKKGITVKVVTKKKIACTTLELVNKFQGLLETFLLHEMNIVYQFKAIKDLKSKLSTKDLLLNIDFSENFLCKYSSEIQSVHFGASRTQIALHTGVAYSKDFKEAFATMSPVLDHNAAAIMAHLKPILEHLITLRPEVEHLYFLSDSVSSQYRNKSVFFLMATRIPQLFPQLKSVTWNYSESGHGKNAADGVGGTLKRIADDAVAQGKDVNDFCRFMEVLKLKLDKIFVLPIEESLIVEEQQFLSHNTSVIKPIKGTMAVHQACWSREKEGMMMFRTLSCFSCGPADKCDHHHLLEKNVTGQEGEKIVEENQVKRTVTPKSTKSTRLRYEDVYDSDDSLKDKEGKILLD